MERSGYVIVGTNDVDVKSFKSLVFVKRWRSEGGRKLLDCHFCSPITTA